MSYIQKDPQEKKETTLESIKKAVPMPFRIGIGAVLLVIILLLSLRTCGGDDFTSEDGTTLTEQLGDAQKLVDEKNERIKQLKASGSFDKELVQELETEVTDLKNILNLVEDELDNMNTGSTVQTQETRKKVLEAIQKVSIWDQNTEKQIVKASGQAIKSIKDSLRILDADYLAKLEEKNQEIAKLKSELQAAKNNNQNESDKIKTLNARIRALETQVEELKVENGRLVAENLELKASVAQSKGDIALVAKLSQDLDAQRFENRKIATLTNKLEKIENVVSKTGGIQAYYVDKHGRKIELSDANRARDIQKMEVSYYNTNWEDTPVEITITGRNGTASLIKHEKIEMEHAMINYILTPTYEIKGNKMLPKGEYRMLIKNLNTNETTHQDFTVQRGF
jgi:predicted nuclease with TOPRIM domain